MGEADYMKYLGTSFKRREKFPKSLRHSVRGHAMHVVMCKKNMVQVASGKSITLRLLVATFFRRFSVEQRRSKHYLAHCTRARRDSIAEPIGPGASELGRQGGIKDRKLLYLKVGHNGLSMSVQVLCKRHYRPIYEQFKVLASIGLDYKDIFVRCVLEGDNNADIQMNYWVKMDSAGKLAEELAVNVIGNPEGARHG